MPLTASPLLSPSTTLCGQLPLLGSNTMLLRTGILLLLCVSSGSGATLGLFQAQDKETEANPVDPEAAAATTDTVVIAASGEADVATDAQVSDSPATEAPEAVDPPLADEPLSKILDVENPEGGKPAEELQPPGNEKAEEPEAEMDGPAGDPATEGLTEEVVTQEQLSPEHVETNEISPVETHESLNKTSVQEDDSSWSLNSIRGGFQSMHGYFDSLVELVGGHNGVCQYRCRYGDLPQPRSGYQLPEPNGCSSSLVGFQLDLGIPAMTKCCNQIDMCYDTCGNSKYDCDSNFRSCLHDICSDLKKSLGFESKVQACESMADALFNTVWTLGCRPYMNSQRAACYCKGEERDEL